jgi:hypothetical protein
LSTRHTGFVRRSVQWQPGVHPRCRLDTNARCLRPRVTDPAGLRFAPGCTRWLPTDWDLPARAEGGDSNPTTCRAAASSVRESSRATWSCWRSDRLAPPRLRGPPAHGLLADASASEASALGRGANARGDYRDELTHGDRGGEPAAAEASTSKSGRTASAARARHGRREGSLDPSLCLGATGALVGGYRRGERGCGVH